MKISKILTAAIVVAIFNSLIGMITCGGVFNWVYQIEPTNIWKPMNNTLFLLFMGIDLFISLIFVYVYALINKGVPGSNKYAKGALYGLIVWAVGMVPGMLQTYLTMNIASTVVIYWTLWGLVVIPLKGIIAAAIYDSGCCCSCGCKKG